MWMELKVKTFQISISECPLDSVIDPIPIHVNPYLIPLSNLSDLLKPLRTFKVHFKHLQQTSVSETSDNLQPLYLISHP